MARYGDYDLDEQPIARGGQGEVYLGIQASTRREIAVKIAAPGAPSAKALMREIELLRHMHEQGVPDVMPVLDALRIADRPAMVMPRLDRHLGQWLEDLIGAPRPDSLEDIFSKMSRLARALASVHRCAYDGGTVVHRDIKPENIFIDEFGDLYLGDFGGAMAIEGLRAVELALFGTPMWAPLDQLLPGRAIPDSTWDTYALCVILYASLTGARPAYQADPRELLTPAGQALWQAARKAIEAPPAERADWHRKFAKMRKGTKAVDLVDLTGRAALVRGDKRALDQGIHQLGTLAGIPERNLSLLKRGLWSLLVRGLSPLSHPSPPNRYRDALELAETLDDMRDLIKPEVATAPAPSSRLGTLLHGDPAEEFFGDRTGPVAERRAAGPSVGVGIAAAIPVVALFMGAGALGGAAWYYQDQLKTAVEVMAPLPERVTVPTTQVQVDDQVVEVPAFAVDTTEVTVAEWNACVRANECPEIWQRAPDDHPAIGLGLQDAEALCKFRGGKLPTRAQWLALLGPEPYPWQAPEADCGTVVALGCLDSAKTAAVGSTRAGATQVGALDVVGNAWEWTQEGELRGGASVTSRVSMGPALVETPPDGARPELAGARCVYGGGT